LLLTFVCRSGMPKQRGKHDSYCTFLSHLCSVIEMK
jgi:hypothetical protein